MTEVWRIVPNLEGYEASNLGRVRSLRRGPARVLVGTVGPSGFRTVTVSALAGPGGTWPALGERRQSVRRLTVRWAIVTRTPWLGNWGDRYCRHCQNDRNRGSEARKAACRRYYLDHRQPKKPPATRCVDCGIEVQQNDGPGQTIRRCDPCLLEEAKAATRRYRAKSQKEPRVSICSDFGVRILKRPGAVGAAMRAAQDAGSASRRRALSSPAPAGLLMWFSQAFPWAV
jgi:hypothetical protein